MTLTERPAKIIIYEEGSFRFLNTPSNYSVRWAAWKPGDSALLVGNHGTILELKHESLRIVNSGGVVENLRCVSFSKQGHSMIVGNQGLILRMEGESMKRIPIRSANNLRRASFSIAFEVPQ